MVGRFGNGGWLEIGTRARQSIQVHFLPTDRLAQDLGNKCTAQVHKRPIDHNPTPLGRKCTAPAPRAHRKRSGRHSAGPPFTMPHTHPGAAEPLARASGAAEPKAARRRTQACPEPAA
ncbi:MAG: hypothetical protein QOG59_1578 [Solirubrobacteraceae bacterium]|nr:hypothetical protein [Solirubrobacteraceae bacterium]